ARLQLRLRGTAFVLTGEAVADIWRTLTASARSHYGGTPAPGTPIADPSAHDARVEPARFAVVRCAVDEIETLLHGADRHRRARFRADAGWRGTWLAP
ncbi:MAG: pyridoxamine 5'-phosphate oxidase, partial [Alphaproteobacteria bacterium]